MIPPTPPTHISVIIPVYNGGEDFGRCLEAFATTGYANYEIVVVDDGSTDGSAVLAEQHGCQVLHTGRPRSGPAVARNLGAQTARGDVLFFVDADVAVRPETVGLVAQAFDADPGLAALFGSYDDAPGASNFLSQYKNLFHHYVHQHSGEQAASFWSGCGAMRREVFLRHGGFDTALYHRPCIEDIELGYRVTRSGERIRLVKTLQVKHLKHWTIASLLRSDILDRGIPWTRLLLREKAFANDLNLQTHNRLSVAATWLLVFCLAAGFFAPWLWLIAAGAAGMLLVLNWPVYRWFASQRGWPFALAVIPWHGFYYLYNGLSFLAGLGAHVIQSIRSPNAAQSQAERTLATPLPDERAQPNSSSTLTFWVVVLAVLMAAWALRLYRLDFQDIWWDEARNIDVASQAIGQIAGNPRLDIQPPLYFYGLNLWMGVAGRQAFATRFLSAGFGMVAIALSYRLARELVPGRRGQLAGVLAILLAGVSAYGLAEAQETRMYTLTWALLAAAMLAMWRAVVSYNHSWRRQAGWWGLAALLMAVALTTHYSTAIILAAWAVWLLAWALRGPGRWKRLTTLAIVALVTAVLLLPAAPIALRQIPGYDNPNLNLPELKDYLGQLYRAFTMGEFVPARSWGISRWLWLLLPLGGVVAALLARSKGIRTTRWNRLAALLLWLVGGLALYYGILLSRPAFNPRYISFVLPALWAFAGWALAQWDGVAQPLPWIAAGALVILTVPSLHADLTDTENFREDTRGVVRWLEQQAGPDDVVLVDQAYPFGVYWKRWNPDPGGEPMADASEQPPAYYLAADVTRIDEQLRDLAGQARQVFWVTWFESDTDPKGVVRDLLDAYGTPLGSQDFRGYSVSGWQLGPAPDFRLPDSYQPIGIGFEPRVTLLEGDWLGRTAPADKAHPALVALRWQADQATPQSLKVSLRLKDAAGVTVAQNDRLLLSDRHLRTDAWQPGETALAIYSLPLADVPPGTYDLALVVYDERTLAPVGLADGSGVEAIVGTLRIIDTR